MLEGSVCSRSNQVSHSLPDWITLGLFKFLFLNKGDYYYYNRFHRRIKSFCDMKHRSVKSRINKVSLLNLQCISDCPVDKMSKLSHFDPGLYGQQWQKNGCYSSALWNVPFSCHVIDILSSQYSNHHNPSSWLSGYQPLSQGFYLLIRAPPMRREKSWERALPKRVIPIQKVKIWTRKMFRILTKRILTQCLFKKR